MSLACSRMIERHCAAVNGADERSRFGRYRKRRDRQASKEFAALSCISGMERPDRAVGLQPLSAIPFQIEYKNISLISEILPSCLRFETRNSSVTARRFKPPYEQYVWEMRRFHLLMNDPPVNCASAGVCLARALTARGSVRKHRILKHKKPCFCLCLKHLFSKRAFVHFCA